MYKAIDLFSGAGGLTQGLKDAGFRVIGAIDIEPLAVKTYKLNHPKVHVWEQDITKLTAEEIMQQLNIKKGELDLLAGCPPCQGFSTIRTRNKNRSVFDPRNDLIFRFLDYIKVMEPKAVMVENVPNLAKDSRIEIFIKDLKKLGYDVGDTPKVLNAAEYGVPQRRRRMIIMATKFGAVESDKDHVASLKTVREAIGALPIPGNSGDPLHDIPEKRTEKVMQMIKLIPKNGGSRTDLPKEYVLECHTKVSGFTDVYGRMHWDKPAPTITSGCVQPSKGRYLHPEQDRAITLREAAILQGFPSDYKFTLEGGKDAVALMIGNALPPKFIKYHAEKIKEVIINGRR